MKGFDLKDKLITAGFTIALTLLGFTFRTVLQTKEDLATYKVANNKDHLLLIGKIESYELANNKEYDVITCELEDHKGLLASYDIRITTNRENHIRMAAIKNEDEDFDFDVD